MFHKTTLALFFAIIFAASIVAVGFITVDARCPENFNEEAEVREVTKKSVLHFLKNPEKSTELGLGEGEVRSLLDFHDTTRKENPRVWNAWCNVIGSETNLAIVQIANQVNEEIDVSDAEVCEQDGFCQDNRPEHASDPNSCIAPDTCQGAFRCENSFMQRDCECAQTNCFQGEEPIIGGVCSRKILVECKLIEGDSPNDQRGERRDQPQQPEQETQPDEPEDADGDGVLSTNDADDTDPYVCSDTDGDGCDDCSSGSLNVEADGEDTDADGLCNVGDTDDDGDDVLDEDDDFPLDAKQFTKFPRITSPSPGSELDTRSYEFRFDRADIPVSEVWVWAYHVDDGVRSRFSSSRTSANYQSISIIEGESEKVVVELGIFVPEHSANDKYAAGWHRYPFEYEFDD